MSEDIVRIDDAGRLVIPPEILQQMGRAEGTTLDLAVSADSRVVLHQP